MPALKKVGGQKKERSQDRRRRLERDRKAKQAAMKYVLPGILLLLSVLVGLFFWKYGFGGVRAKPIVNAAV
jgi:hypothetical protein